MRKALRPFGGPRDRPSVDQSERRSRFVSLLHRTPPRTVCPNFYLLAHANGCAFAPGCEYCYLASSLWSLKRPRVFTNVEQLLAEVKAWIGRDRLPSTVLNTGNLSDSLGFEGARPLAARLVELFREEAEAKGRPHELLIVTKGGRRQTAPLASARPCRNVILSFSVNSPEAAALHERGVPPVQERLAAARELSAGGWRIRIRIDPMIKGFDYVPVGRQVSELEPERVTLGCLRAEPGLLRRARREIFQELEPAVEKTGLARYPVDERLHLYRQALAGLSGNEVGLCEETPDMWAALGLDPSERSCNCGA